MTENNSNKTESQYEYSFEYIQKKLEGKKDSFGMLMKEIVRTGICTQCATCTSVCPVLIWDDLSNQPKLIGKCNKNYGNEWRRSCVYSSGWGD